MRSAWHWKERKLGKKCKNLSAYFWLGCPYFFVKFSKFSLLMTKFFEYLLKAEYLTILKI